LEVGVPVCILNAEDKDIGNYVGLTGVIVEIDEGDNGAQPMDPLYIVQFDDGRNAGFWSDELKICQELACV
jgi:hypothetical protein